MATQRKGSPASTGWQRGWRGLCKAGDKAFGPQTVIVSPAGAPDEDQVRCGGAGGHGTEESPIVGLPTPASFPLFISILFQIPNTVPVTDGLDNGK